MPRLIDADKARKEATIDLVVHLLDRQPTIDAVPVVRCKDCLWYKAEDGCPLKESGYFKDGKMLPFENDFCSWGERKE